VGISKWNGHQNRREIRALSPTDRALFSFEKHFEFKEALILTSLAYAMGQGGLGGGQGSGGGFTAFIPLILMFVIFYFLLIRPQQKKSKDHREMIGSLKKGDRIITSGGIHGIITGADENTLTLEIAEKVRVKLNRGNVAGLVKAAAAPPTPKEENKKSA